MNAIQFVPGIKFIGNTKNGWQPYFSLQVVMNSLTDTHFKANDTVLPEMAVKTYVIYGIGLQRHFGERFTGYAQTMLRSGGRSGVGLQFGFRWAL